MFTRTLDCTLKPELKDKFIAAVQSQILPLVKQQAGFVDTMCLISDENPDHALVLTFWKTKSEAEEFYRYSAPMRDLLKPFTSKIQMEHYLVETSAAFKVASGKAA